jgi:hypothetical protein
LECFAYAPFPATFAEDVINQPARAQFEAFLDEHRSQLNRCLDGLTDEQAPVAGTFPDGGVGFRRAARPQ